MSYFIKPTYPDLNELNPSIYYKSWVDNIEIDDNYGSWNFNGDFYIYSNSFLPINSFYLNLKTYFASVLNIPLKWEKEYISKEILNTKNPAYNINQYSFNFMLDTKKSNLDENIQNNKNINFNFEPVFNQNIFNDYVITGLNNDVDRYIFINEVNKNIVNFNVQYSNFYEINNENGKINLNPYVNNSTELLTYGIDSFNNLEEPINSIINFKKNNIENIVLSNINFAVDYYIDNILKTLKFSINNQYLFGNDFSLKIDQNFYFNDETKTLELAIKEGYGGIFIPYNSKGNINCSFDIEFKNKIKRIEIKKPFSFIKNIKNNLINKTLIKTITIENLEDYINGNEII